MQIDSETAAELDVALNEALLLGAEYDAGLNLVATTFENLSIRDPLGATISIAEFTAGGRRWWDALHAGDSRTQGHGIVPDGRAD